jgi:hypothetical protein
MWKEDNRIRLQTVLFNSSNRSYSQRKAINFPSLLTVVSRTTSLFIITRCSGILTDFLVVVGQRVIKLTDVKNEQIALVYWHAQSCETVRIDCHITDI